MNAINKYYMLKSAMDQAYGRFDANPTQQNSDLYGMALNEFRDYCVEVVGKLITSVPEVLEDLTEGDRDKFYWFKFEDGYRECARGYSRLELQHLVIKHGNLISVEED